MAKGRDTTRRRSKTRVTIRYKRTPGGIYWVGGRGRWVKVVRSGWVKEEMSEEGVEVRKETWNNLPLPSMSSTT